mmetsp:Transcript_29038/g.43794  ORF Transcript_29038/g.43794 Transcript_29038/m.43794 type:complete len:93 (+) Transcript_29038:937-1215(+)
MGLIVAANGMYLTKESEEEDEDSLSRIEEDEHEEGSKFWRKLKKNLGQIWEAMMMPEIQMVIGFFLLNGILSPDFGDFSYYFMLNVAKISKF